jgi:peptide/nickel transport system ATP-binding protein
VSEPIVEVEDLVVTTSRGTVLIDGISFGLDRRSRTGLIGESGSGKSLTALSILGLLPEGLTARGSILLNGRELTSTPERQLCAVRGNEVSMIFQEPMTALNPVMRIGRQIAEALRIHREISKQRAEERVVELLQAVGIPQPEVRARAFPHQLSGGMRQRAMIAMAIGCGPDLVIADEPTTALDVTIQAQVLDVLQDQVDRLDTALLLITHDLPVVARITDEVLVMNDGRLLERGMTQDVFMRPVDPYTKTLVSAVPPLSRSSDVPVVRRQPRKPSAPAIVVERVSRDFALPRTGLFGRPSSTIAVDDVSLEVQRGETFGIVGESGSGKTTLARMMIALDVPTRGRIMVDGIDVGATPDHDRLRRHVQMVFQDPMGSLDPRLTVETIISEPLRSLQVDGDHRERVRELLEAVDLPTDSATRYPHEFSGGQRQRIAIARALAPHPDILVADEPVSALDMSVQTRTLDILAQLKEVFGLTMVFISHDLSVVHEICDRVAVMQNGQVVEMGSADSVFIDPQTEYARRLIAAIPRLDGS